MSLPHKEVSSVRGAKVDWHLHQILISKSGSFLQTPLFVLAHSFSSLQVVRYLDIILFLDGLYMYDPTIIPNSIPNLLPH